TPNQISSPGHGKVGLAATFQRRQRKPTIRCLVPSTETPRAWEALQSHPLLRHLGSCNKLGSSSEARPVRPTAGVQRFCRFAGYPQEAGLLPAGSSTVDV